MAWVATKTGRITMPGVIFTPVGTCVEGALAWLGGVSTYHLLANLYPDVGATLPSLILAGLLQLLLGRAFSYGRGTARA